MTADDARRVSADGMTRAQFTTRAASALVATAGLAAYARTRSARAAYSTRAGRATGGTLNLYTWPDYYAAKNLADFKKTSGIKINTSVLESNDALFAKLNSPAGANYDLVIPSQYWVGIEAQKNLLLKLDKSRIPMQYVDKSLLAKLPAPVNDYAIPKDYGTIGVIWDPTVVGGDIKTWQDYLDAGSKPGVSGKVELTDVPDETLAIALWAMGKSSNTTNKADLSKAADTMKAFAKNVKAFNEFDTDGLANGSIVMAVVSQGTAREVMLQNKKLKYVIPQPHSKLWVDEYAIPAKAKNVDQAYSFINFMLQPARQLADTAFLGYPTALPGLASKLPSSVPLRNVIFIQPADLERLVAYVVHPEIQGYVEQLYSQVKAAAG
jgi:spermidine/putrescine transport system substrate-binding protein